jgi:hypothetical protein
MEFSSMTSTNESTWDVVPDSNIAGIVLAVLFLYLFLRHMLFVLMIMDFILGWLRKFYWFPKEGKRLRTFVHWVIAVGVLLGFLGIGRFAGWLKFVPQ